MKRGRPREFELTLNNEERVQIEQMSGSRTLPAGIVRRARGILLSADGESNQSIARALKVSTASVTYWQKRFGMDRLAGLHDLPKSGRPFTHADDRIADLLNKVLRQRPKQATHWSIRGVAAETGVSKNTVQRYFGLFGLQPHRSKSF